MFAINIDIMTSIFNISRRHDGESFHQNEVLGERMVLRVIQFKRLKRKEIIYLMQSNNIHVKKMHVSNLQKKFVI